MCVGACAMVREHVCANFLNSHCGCIRPPKVHQIRCQCWSDGRRLSQSTETDFCSTPRWCSLWCCPARWCGPRCFRRGTASSSCAGRSSRGISCEYPHDHTTITPRSQYDHTTITPCWFYDHTTITLWSHYDHTTITPWSLDDHSKVTPWSRYIITPWSNLCRGRVLRVMSVTFKSALIESVPFSCRRRSIVGRSKRLRSCNGGFTCLDAAFFFIVTFLVFQLSALISTRCRAPSQKHNMYALFGNCLAHLSVVR